MTASLNSNESAASARRDALDAQLDRQFGPSDPATDAWIAAYDAVRRGDGAEVGRLATLLVGTADYSRLGGGR